MSMAIDPGDERLLREAVREFLQRSSRMTEGQSTSDHLLGELHQLGWIDLAESAISLGHLGIVQREIGYATVTAPIAEMLTAGFCLMKIGQPFHDIYQDGIQKGEVVQILGGPGTWGSVGHRDGRLTSSTGLVANVELNPRLWIVPTRSNEGVVNVWAVRREDIRDQDGPGRGLGGDVVSMMDVDGIQAECIGVLDNVAWDAIQAFYKILVACQLLGVSERALSLTRDHTLDRVQFGRPLAELPVVRHLLSDAVINFRAAELATREAVDSWGPLLGNPPVGFQESAVISVLSAGRSAEFVVAVGSQLHGGSGFMDRHPMSQLFRSAKALRLRVAGEHQHLDALRVGLEVVAEKPPYLSVASWREL